MILTPGTYVLCPTCGGNWRFPITVRDGDKLDCSCGAQYQVSNRALELAGLKADYKGRID